MCSVQHDCVTLSSLSFRPVGVVLLPVGARNAAAVVAEVPEMALTEGTQKIGLPSDLPRLPESSIQL